MNGPGPPCYCGKHGCLETFISGTGLAIDYESARQDRGSASTPPRLSPAPRRAIRLPAQRSTAMRTASRAAWRRSSTCSTPTRSSWAAACRTSAELYHIVPRLLPRFVFSDRVDTVIVPPKHGDSSGVRGAAWLWSPEEATAFAAGAATTTR